MPAVETPVGGAGQACDHHTRDTVLSSARSRVQVTPHRLVVVLFVREYCNYKLSLPLSPVDRAAVCQLILTLIQTPDLDLSNTAKKLVEKIKLPGYVSDWIKGVVKLHEDGVAGIMDLVQSIDKLLTVDNFPVSRSSVLGLFLRQVFLSFDKLSFSEVSALNQQYDIYYKSGKYALKRMLETGESVGGESFDMSLESERSGSRVEYNLPASLPAEFAEDCSEDTSDEQQPECGVSKKQAELFLAQQAKYLQSNEKLAMSPQDLQAEIQRILKFCPGLPEANFLSYLNCMRVKEMCEASHSLYASCSQHNNTNIQMQNDFRFAALNLASYHVNMQNKSEALSTIKEAISMAQEASDHACLQHVLSLLHRIVDDKDKTRMMERCVSKSGELGLPYLQSLSLLAQATHLVTGQSDAGHVLELVSSSHLLNCLHSLSDLGAVAVMVRSAVWSVYGKTGMSVSLAQLLLLQLVIQHGESEALALASVIKWLDSQAMSEHADKVIKVGQHCFGSSSSQWNHIIVEATERVNLRRAQVNQCWSDVERSLVKLGSSKRRDHKLLTAEVLMKQGKIVESRDCLQTLLSDSTTPADVRVGTLILLSNIFIISGTPAAAVQYLVEAIHLAKETHQDMLYHLSSIHLANCHLNLGFPDKGLSLTLSHLPGILSHAGVSDAAMAWLLVAKCKIAASKGLDGPLRRAKMLEGADLINKAREMFQLLDDHARVQDCLYLLARVYHNLQLTQERNTAASQFKKMEDLHPTKSRINLVQL